MTPTDPDATPTIPLYRILILKILNPLLVSSINQSKYKSKLPNKSYSTVWLYQSPTVIRNTVDWEHNQQVIFHFEAKIYNFM